MMHGNTKLKHTAYFGYRTQDSYFEFHLNIIFTCASSGLSQMASSLKTLRLSHFLNFLSSVVHVSVPSVSSSLHLYSIHLQSQCNCCDEELTISLMLVIRERGVGRIMWTGIIHTAVLSNIKSRYLLLPPSFTAQRLPVYQSQ